LWVQSSLSEMLVGVECVCASIHRDGLRVCIRVSIAIMCLIKNIYNKRDVTNLASRLHLKDCVLSKIWV